MNDLVKLIQKSYCRNCFVKNCSQHGCSISLDNAPNPYIIMDFDTLSSPLGPEETRCDYLFISNKKKDIPNYIIPIEITSGKTKRATKIRDQLQSGTRIAEQSIPRDIPATFCPVFVGRLSKLERPKLRKDANMIRFRDQKTYPRIINCGDPLTNALEAGET